MVKRDLGFVVMVVMMMVMLMLVMLVMVTVMMIISIVYVGGFLIFLLFASLPLSSPLFIVLLPLQFLFSFSTS